MNASVRTVRLAAIAAVLHTLSGTASAAQYHWLANELYEGWVPSADGLWGPGFDSPLAGANPLAAATFFADEAGNFGGVVGTLSTDFSAPAVYGENLFTDGMFTLSITNFSVGLINFIGNQIFDPELVSSIVINPDRTASATYHLVDGFGQQASFHGNYIWLLPDDDIGAYVPDEDFHAHLEFLIETLAGELDLVPCRVRVLRLHQRPAERGSGGAQQGGLLARSGCGSGTAAGWPAAHRFRAWRPRLAASAVRIRGRVAP